MQANPFPPILPPQWRHLQAHEEIRISQQDAAIQIVSHEALQQNQAFHNHVETLYILRQLAARLFNPIRPRSDTALDNRVDAIHKRIFQSLSLNPQAVPDSAALEPIHRELQAMIAFILQRREEKKAARTAAVSKNEAILGRQGDQILQPAAEAAAPKTPLVTLSSAEADKKFRKMLKSLEQLQEKEKQLKLQREQQAKSLAQEHQGYNPLDDDNEVKGDYFNFIHKLKLRIGNQDHLLQPCRQKLETRLKDFLTYSLTSIRLSEECRDLLENWTQLVDTYEVDRIQFGRLVGLCLSEEHAYLLISQALKDDLADTNKPNEVFRSTYLLRGTIIGGFFTRLVFQTIRQPIQQCLVNLEKMPLPDDENTIRPHVQTLLDLIRIRFLECSFSPVALELLHQADINIYKKWHISGIKHLLATLFLRGATHIITDHCLTSPNKMALRQLGKMLQREINQFSNWTFHDMENHLLALLKTHTRTYPQGYNPIPKPLT